MGWEMSWQESSPIEDGVLISMRARAKRAARNPIKLLRFKFPWRREAELPLFSQNIPIAVARYLDACTNKKNNLPWRVSVRGWATVNDEATVVTCRTLFVSWILKPLLASPESTGNSWRAGGTLRFGIDEPCLVNPSTTRHPVWNVSTCSAACPRCVGDRDLCRRFSVGRLGLPRQRFYACGPSCCVYCLGTCVEVLISWG